MRFKFLALLWLYAGIANASWTGVALEVTNYDSDWEFETDIREAQITSVDFQIEEKTSTELRVGIAIGYFDMRLVPDSGAPTRKFDGNYLGIYLRQPLRLGEHLGLYGLFSVRYSDGNESGEQEDEDEAEIEWVDSRIELGLGYKVANFRITPFVAYQHVDGDVSDEQGTNVFDADDAQTVGVQLDYFIEQDAFMRFEFRDGGQAGAYLTFARRF